MTLGTSELPAPHELNICLIWHSLYSPNLGVNALTYSMIRYLEEASQQENIHLKYTILGNSPSEQSTDHVNICGKMVQIRYDRLRLPERVDLKTPRNWLRIAKWLLYKPPHYFNDLRSYSLILDISEGDSFTDIYGQERFIDLSMTKLFTLKSGKELVLLPQTIGPFRERSSRLIAKYIMGRIRSVYPRDGLSRHLLERMFPDREYQDYLDVAFHLPYNQRDFDQTKTHVGINVSALLWHGGYSEDNMFGLSVNYRELIGMILDFFTRQPDLAVHLVPHVVHCESFPIEYDHALAQVLNKQLPDTILAPEFADPIEAKSYISGLDFFIGSRMHACIAAFSAGIPVTSLAYSRKFSGLFTSSLNYPAVIDMHHVSTDEAFRSIQFFFEDRNELKRIIAERKDFLDRNTTAFRQEIASLLRTAYDTKRD